MRCRWCRAPPPGRARRSTSRSLTQNTSGVPSAAEAGDTFGTAVASAALDTDGYADLVVGAPLRGHGGRHARRHSGDRLGRRVRSLGRRAPPLSITAATRATATARPWPSATSTPTVTPSRRRWAAPGSSASGSSTTP
ncbi:integrin alpha [Streptomyces bottropensis]|uniref:integrin alpha n=1 Tax=Streptomyces bottropensis TaxID=42235 RepID=UPI0036AB0467